MECYDLGIIQKGCWCWLTGNNQPGLVSVISQTGDPAGGCYCGNIEYEAGTYGYSAAADR